jgi:hypothetical protein
MNKITWFIFARDAQIILLIPRHISSLFERWIHVHSATYHRSLYPRQHADGLLCPLVRWGEQSKHFPSNAPTKENRWGSDLGTAEASVLVLLDHRPWNFSSIKLRTRLPQCSGAPWCWYHVLSGGQRNVLQECWQCLVHERVVYRGGKAFRQEIRINDTVS